MRFLHHLTFTTLIPVVVVPFTIGLAHAGDTPGRHDGAYIGATAALSGKGAIIKRRGASRKLDYDKSSASFGLVGGYNWVFRENILLGLEADFSTMGSDASTSDAVLGQVKTTGNLVGSMRARAGFIWNKAMFYGTAGIAFSDIDTRPSGTRSKNDIRTGLVLGLGAEYAINEDWSARLEGLSYGFTDNRLGNTRRDVAMGYSTIRIGLIKKF